MITKAGTAEDTLEQMIDSLGITIVLHMLAAICDGKTNHVAIHWQDTTLAKRWARIGDGLNRIATHSEGM